MSQTKSRRRLSPQSAFDVIAIGVSLGGLTALGIILSALPSDFPAPLLIVQHRHADYPSLIERAVARNSNLQVQPVQQGTRMHPASVYIAPADHHMSVTASGRLRLSQGAKVSFARPSVDVLFHSAAECFRERAIGVVLTGMLDDGAKGAQSIKSMGGRVLAQDKMTSTAFSMPHAAICTGAVDFVLPIDKIAPALVTLTMLKGANSVFPGSMPLLGLVG